MMGEHVVAVVQARMTSTRLPGKVLMPLGRSTVLGWVVARLQATTKLDDVVIATSFDPTDDPIADTAGELGIDVVRGSLDDVLDRYRFAAEWSGADVVVRITADCPLLDPTIVDRAIETRAVENADLASTNLGEVLHGLDTEVVRRDALSAAARDATDVEEREHVTLFFYRRQDRYRCSPVPLPDWARRGDLRLTVDEPADLSVVRALVSRIGDDPTSFSTAEAIQLLDREPSIASLNAAVEHRELR